MKKLSIFLFIINTFVFLNSCVKIDYEDDSIQNPEHMHSGDHYTDDFYINNDKNIFKCDDFVINTMVDHIYLYDDIISQILISVKKIPCNDISNIIIKTKCLDRSGNVLVDTVDESIYKFICFEFNQTHDQYIYNKCVNFYNRYTFTVQIVSIKVEYFNSKYNKLYNIQ